MKARVLSCVELTADRGDTYFHMQVEGVDKKVQDYKFHGPDSFIDTDLLKLSPRGDIYYLKATKDIAAPKVTQSITVSLSILRAIVDLAAAGQVKIVNKKGHIKKDYVVALGKEMADAVKQIGEEPNA